MEAVAENLIEATTVRMTASKALWTAKAEGLCFAFGGNRIIDRVNFTLRTGEAVLLRGENGSGKTTLLNILSGLIRPDSGNIILNIRGRVINVNRTPSERLARSGLGRLWQDIRLFPTMTALENILAASPDLLARTALAGMVFWSVVRRLEKAARERALHNLELVGMADRAHSSADMLSVGQMKRVALARLLQAEVDFWLLDEPLAGLDHKSAEGLLALLVSLIARNGKTMFIIEHQHERMAPICNRTWFLANGHLHTERAG